MAQPRPEDLAVHAEFLRRLAQRLLRSPDLVDDAVQETLALAWEKQPATTRMRGWLAGTLRNVVRNQRRATRRRDARHGALSPREAASPEAVREREATRKNLIRAVLALPDAAREVVLLRFEQGLPPRRIAAELGIPVHTVHNRLRSGLARLRAMLEHEYADREDGRDWRAALGALVPALPQAGGAGAALGGSLVLKKIITVAAVALLLVGGWWAVDRMTTDEPAAPIEAGDAEVINDPAATGPALAPRVADDDGDAGRDVPAARVPLIFGRVIAEADRAPVAGATVRALGYEGLVELTATTDDEGRFRLEETAGRRGAFHLVVHGEGYARKAVARAFPSVDERTIGLGSGGWITGRVVDHDGGAVGAAQVRSVLRLTAAEYDEDPRQKMIRRAIPRSVDPRIAVDIDPASGTFRLGPLRPGRHALELLVADRAPVERVPPGSQSSWERGFLLSAGETLDVGTLKLPRYEALALRVVDGATEQVLERVSFSGFSNPAYGATRFPVEILGRTKSGAYLLPLAVNAKGYMGLDVEIEARGYARTKFNISGTHLDDEHVVRMYPHGRITVTVHRDDGEPVAGGVAYVRRGMDHAVLAICSVAPADQAGTFTADELPAGEQLEVFVFDPGMDRQISMTQFTLKAGEHRRLTLGGDDRGAIRGVVRLGGEPLRGVFATLDDPDGRRRQAWTGRDGYFRFDDLEEGTFRLYLNMGEHRAMLDRRFEVRKGAVVDASVDMQHQITGKVQIEGKLPKHTPLDPPDMMFVLGDPAEGGIEVSVRPAADGTFETYVPRAGEYRVLSDDANFYVPGDRRVVVDDKSADAGELVVHPDPKDAVVEIRVVEKGTGKDVPEASASYTARQSSGALLATTNGVLRSNACRIGLRRYTVGAPGFVAATVTIEIVPDRKLERRTVELQRSNGVRITGFTPQSRAEAAGVVAGDILWTYSGTRVTSIKTLAAAIKAASVDDLVRIVVWRDGDQVSLDIPGGRMGVYVATAYVKEPD